MRSDLPSGTVTFLFTDVEGSTRLLHQRGAAGYAEALTEHRRIVRDACATTGGIEVDTQGDAFFFAFSTAPGALEAAAAFTDALAAGPVQVRVGLHTGTPLLTDEGYVGGDVHRAARIAACGHGGQVLVSSSTAQLVELELADLGEHRLKDLSAPERIYQLGSGNFPPLKSLYHTNLPVPATPFLGRADELADVVGLLAETRLLTLTGPGGTGKTRLALQAAGVAADAYPDGVWWVPLAPLRDPALVMTTAAHALGSKNGLADHISDKAMLCVFDNFEQVVDAGAALAELVAACPRLAVLVTSRERLRVGGEQTYPVPPLAEEDGVALFSARARAVDPAFVAGEVVYELCDRLDELPLALELAAARTALFSPKQLLERLAERLDLLKGERDADPRQQTLRATIEWSYELMSAEEQKLFTRLAVFAGGCTYEAAEEIAGADPDGLQSLLDKSLLRKRESEAGPRFWMLETIREYAGERLEASHEGDELRHRHTELFLALAEEAEPHLEKDPEWLDRLRPEHDNLRAALDRLETSGDVQIALRLAGALAGFWEVGHLTEGRQRFESLLPRDERPTSARAKALAGAALMARQSGDAEGARLHAEEALALHRELGDAWGTANAGVMLGLAVADKGDFARARQLYEDSARLFRDAGDEDGALFATRLLAWIYEELGDRERAGALLTENLSRARARGNRQIEGQTLAALASLAVEQGQAREAVSMLQDVLRIDRDRAVPLQTAFDLSRFARALALVGESGADAARILSSAEAIRDDIGAGAPPFLAHVNEEALNAIRSQLDDIAFAEAWEQGQALTPDEAIAIALGE